MKFIKDLADRVRRYCDGRDTREDLVRLEFERASLDYDCSKEDFSDECVEYIPPEVRDRRHDLKLALTNTAEFESGLLKERRWFTSHSRMKQADLCTTVGVRYRNNPAEMDGVNPIAGIILFKPQDLYFEVDFNDPSVANPLKPLRWFPRGESYDEIKNRFPSEFYYLEHSTINYLRQVLSIHDKHDPVLHTPLESIPAPLYLGPNAFDGYRKGNKRSTPKVHKYIPLSNADDSLITGLLNSCFAQMRERIWF